MRFQSLIIVFTHRQWLAAGLLFFCLPFAMADSSSITEAEGYSCMGVDYSRKETENLALQDASGKRSSFRPRNREHDSDGEFRAQQDLVEAFARADVKVIDVITATWQDTDQGDCYTIRIKRRWFLLKSALNG